jgi:pyruvate/2-oxoglutarate dehydrogenase complex dihydrolipoamide acyltransferase (E2) component
MRKIIAKRLAESLFTAPHYNLSIEVTMDDAMQARTTINSSEAAHENAQRHRQLSLSR